MRTTRRGARRLSGVLLAAAIASQAAAAQVAPPPGNGAARVVHVDFENDLIAVRGAGVPEDYDYTSGIRLATTLSTAPWWLGRMTGRPASCVSEDARAQGCVATAYAFTHEIYTPRRNAVQPVAGERPYAGWMYGTMRVSTVRPGHSRTFAADLGVVGPMAFARQVQNGLHKLLDNTPKLGWQHQIANAPGVVLRYDEGVRRRRAGRTLEMATDVRWSAATGTLLTAVSGGAEVSVGRRGTLPWSPLEPRIEHPSPVFLSVAYRQDAVLHSVLVEGRGGAHGAARRAMVGQLEAGLGVRHRIGAATYRYVVRGREYDAQPAPHPYGSLSVSINRFSR